MNKNNFMKAMSMIDEELLHEADTPYTPKGAEDTSNEIYRENETSDSVSGVDVYHGFLWKKFLAVAATFVIVAGAVGGGAYYYSQHKANNNNNNISDEYAEYNHVYNKLKENKESYHGDFMVNDGSQVRFRRVGLDIEPFINYMDNADANSIMEEDIIESGRSIIINFYEEKDQEEFAEEIEQSEEGDKIPIYDTALFTFTLYENGCYTLTDNETETTERRRFADGSKVFEDILEIYADGETLEQINTLTPEEAEEILNAAFAEGENDKAYYSSADRDRNIEYTVNDKEGLKNDLLKFEWKRTKEFDYTNYYSVYGLELSEQGYISANYAGSKIVCKLKNDIAAEKIQFVISEHFVLSDEISLSPTNIKNYLQIIDSENTVQWLEGSTGIPQGKIHYDTIVRYYSVNSPEGFINEIASLEWESCEESEITDETGYRSEGGYYISYGSYEIATDENENNKKTISIYPKGYMSFDSNIGYKLKNEGDADKLTEICNKYLTMDEGSEFAKKICNGITGYDNLRAHYTYETYINNDLIESVSGYLSVDAKNEKMYMTGEGTTIWNEPKNIISEVVMNGHDHSAYRITDKDTSEDLDFGLYPYSNGYLTPQPEYHYIYICKDAEKALTPRYSFMYNADNYSLESSVVDGCTVINLNNGAGNNGAGKTVRIVLNENGQVLTYETNLEGYKSIFRLDDYVFDSPDFTIEDVDSVCESIKKEQETQEEQ